MKKIFIPSHTDCFRLKIRNETSYHVVFLSKNSFKNFLKRYKINWKHKYNLHRGDMQVFTNDPGIFKNFPENTDYI